MGEWGGHAEASARRLQLRVTTPLASTAIFHLLTSFQNFGVTIPGPGANQKGPVLVRKGSFATRHREPTGLLSFRIEDSAREISVVLVRRPPTREGSRPPLKIGQFQRFGRLSWLIALRRPACGQHFFRCFGGAHRTEQAISKFVFTLPTGRIEQQRGEGGDRRQSTVYRKKSG